MEPVENNSRADGTNNLASSYFPKDEDIEPVASGSLLKVNGDNHISGLPFKQHDEDSSSSSNSSSSHNLVIDQPEEITNNNNAGNESEGETLKKVWQKDLSVNPLKRKFNAQENGSPEHKQINISNSNTVFTKSPQKLINNSSPSEFFKEGKADINENRSSLNLSEAYEKKFKALTGSKGDGEDHFQEYAKYLRLKPAVKYKCFKCYNITFDTLAQLRNHQKVCFFKDNHRHSSQDGNSVDAFLSSNSNPSSIDNLSALAASEQMQAKLQKQFLDTKTTTKAKKKVFLCAACGTYYENWNLFLHMREVHKRHICLYCVGMFPTAEKLTLHLEMKHDLEQNHFENHEKLLRSSRDTCYLMCCICENIFTEHDDFQDHTCTPLIPPCRYCGQSGRHNSNCTQGKPERVKDKVKRKNKNNKESSTREKRLEPGIQSAAERTRLVGDSSCDTPKTRTENPSHWNFKANGCVPDANVRHSEQPVKSNEVNSVDKRSPAKKDVVNLPKLNNSQGDVQMRYPDDEQGSNFNRTSSQVEDFAQAPRPTILKSILSEENKGRRSPQINSLFPAMREKSFKGHDNEEGKFSSPLKELSNENNNNPLSDVEETESNATPSGDSIQSTNTNSVEPPKEEKPPEKLLFVPKFKIKIPKEYQTPIDSEHSSTESDEEEMENSANGGEISEEENKEEFQNNIDENVDIPEKMEQDPEPVQEEQEKSLESNTSKELDEQEQKIPEDLENRRDSDNNMDIEAPIEIHEAPKESPPDGIEVAGDDILIVELLLDRPLDKIPMVEFLRICMRSTYPLCLYCNHARRIAVNGNSLALHMIAQHRFSATVDSITAEELQPPTIVSKLKAFLPDLEEIFFNMETYCSTDKEVFHPYEKIFECFLCRFETRVHKELYLHNRKMHLKTAILCFMCRANFFSYSEILCHMCPGMPSKCVIFDIKFRCCLCDLDQIPSAFRLMVHLRKKHFACDVCLEDCQDQSKLSSHVWKHKLHHLCYRCGIAYRNKPDITKHLFWKHGTESILCKRCLQKRWPHVYHFCIPPLSFNCDGCSLTFSKATSLKVHKRIHTGYAPYPCTEDNCEEKFISRKLLLKHVASHNESPEVKPIEDVKEEEGKKDEDIKPENDADDETKKDSESGKKKKKKIKKESKNSIDDLMNLPAPNLSESDSSDDSESMRAKQDSLGPHVPKVMLSPPSDVGEDDKENSTGVIMDIWENFKSFQASRNKNKTEEDEFDEVPMTPMLHVSQSDHDYCMMYKPITKDDKTDIDIKEISEKSIAIKETTSPKKKQKSPRKAPKSGSDSSSSGSSSSSDSSCSCGSNCSCSSSSGSSSDSSSSSDDSDSSTSEGRRRIAAKRAAKEEKRNRNKSESSKANTTEMVDVVGTDTKPVDTNSAIMETDLETDESDTDEDFYDEHPQKLASQMLAEKRKQLMIQTCLSPSHNFDIVENSRPSTPSLPEEMMKEKKVKIKKKKRDKKSSKGGIIPTLKLTIPSFSGPVNTPIVNPIKIQEPLPPPPVEVAPQVEKLTPPIPDLLPLPSVVPQVPPVTLQVPQQPQALQISQSRTSTPIPAPVAPRNRLSTGSSSDADAPLKRSKRARRPNRFYGYSSDDDSTTPHLTGPAAFKPTPPPNLTWRKEDLPAPSKSISAKSSKGSGNSLKKNTPTNTPPLPPIPPIIIRPTGITSRSSTTVDQKPPVVEPMRVPPVPVHHIQPPPQYYSSSRESMESESSDEDKLHIPVTTKYGAQRHINSIPPPPLPPVQAAPPPPQQQQPPAPPKQRIPPALLPNPDLARLQYFQRNNIRWPIRPPAGARPPREGESVYCYCRCPYDEVSEMIACDGDDCMIEWFHFECVGIMVPPKGKWFCPECKPNYPHEMENYEDT